MSPEAELTAVIIFATITVLFIEDMKFKITGIVVAAVSGLLQIKNGAVGIHKTLDHMMEFIFKSPTNDFRFMIMILSILFLAIAVYGYIKSDSRLLKMHAILVCVTIATCVINAVFYQLNVMFMLYTVIGVFMGMNIRKDNIIGEIR